ARVGVAAACRSRAGVAGVRPFIARPVNVIGNGLEVVINVGIEMRTGLPLVARALNDVEQVWNDAGLDEALALFVEVNAPGIAGAFGEDLEAVLGGMIAPNAGVDARALAVGRAGLADV